MAADETSDNFTPIQIPEEWEPADDESSQQRAIFLFHALDAHVRHNLFRLIARSKSGALGPDAQFCAEKNLTEWIVDAAVKESVCICIQHSLLQQAAFNAPTWLYNFILLSLMEADAVCQQPGSADIVEAYEQIPVASLISALTSRVCQDFGLDARTELARLLSELFESAARLGGELLLLSLTQPIESLSRHLQIYQQ